jgi:hypothetical protein
MGLSAGKWRLDGYEEEAFIGKLREIKNRNVSFLSFKRNLRVI